MSERVAVEGRQPAISPTVFSVASVVGLLAIWTLVTNLGLVGPGYLPSPQAMFAQLVTLVEQGYGGKPLWDHVGASLFRALVGFAIGVLAGVPFGLFSGYHKAVGAIMSPIMAFIRPIPPIAFIPMAVLYFGLGEMGKVVLIVFTAFNYSFVSAQAGALSVPMSYYRAAESIGMTKLQIFWRVVFPSSIPHIFTGLKVAMALSWAVVVAAELVGAQKGLGFMISDAAQLFQIPVVFIGIALIGLIGLVLNVMLTVAEEKIVHWKGR
ncbi:ABC transporter, permease protein [Bordetella bronchiseptica MBORD635]|uniref:ABC transporter permease n=1 Tax=Bordetella bronchiseptica TaxID=518 RepID=UPI000460F85B|nr:ABC transporter permease [Bordetella bronchiseptica]KDC80202.1 ABC transporter, permease protein [Bordetella bronchiseptica MBORD635]